MDAIIEAIENYMLKLTKRNALQLDSALNSLVALEGDLSSIIEDVKEVVEGRV